MKTYLAIIGIIHIATTSLLAQSVSLVFSSSPTNGIAGGFLNDSIANGGVPTNGMKWALVVDTSGGSTGFGALTSGTLNAFDVDTSGQSISTDLVYLFSDGSTPRTTQDVFTESGAITSYTGIPFSGLAASDPFAIIWFPEAASAGSSYGVLTDPGFVLPSEGGTGNYFGLAIFEGTGQFEPAEVFAVPEPSQVAAIFGALALGFVIWRRRR